MTDYNIKSRDLSETVANLRRAISELTTLNQIATAVNVTSSLDGIAQKIIDACVRQIHADFGAIYLVGEESREVEGFETFVRSKDRTEMTAPSSVTKVIIGGWVLKHKRILHWKRDDARTDFDGSFLAVEGVSSFIAVPLLVRSEVIGSLAMFNKNGSPALGEGDCRFLSIVGTQAAKLIENARLYRREKDYIEMIHRQRMESLSSLVAGVMHELNNALAPASSSLSVIKRAFELLREKRATIEKNQARLDAAQEAAGVGARSLERSLSLVKQLKSFARLDQAEKQRCSITDIIEDAITMVMPETRDRITFKTEFSDLPPLLCYPAQLSQALWHLLMNAVEAIADRGHIRVRAFHEEKGIRIEIVDSGRGISPSEIDRVFEPHFTSKGKRVGLGLGLPICRQVVQLHNGDISLERNAGTGTTVVITLPVI